MKTKLLIFSVIAVMVFVSAIQFADARSFSPFSFRLADEIEYDDISFYVDGSKVNLVVRNGETETLPINIKTRESDYGTVAFHATIGNDQMGKIRFPPGVNIQLEPSQMLLDGTEQILNVTVHVSDKAPSSKYKVSIVGVWQEEGFLPDFKGTGFSLHVGDDFGNDAIPVNFFMAPLKFYNEGVPPEEVICRNAYTLILKNNDKPACVKDETKYKLIERGWMKTQVDVFDDDSYIEATKNLDSVKTFLSLHPDANIYVNKEWFSVNYEDSGFREHPTSSVIHHTKRLIISLDYEGKPTTYMFECGGPISLSMHDKDAIRKHLQNRDWCFPYDQSQFAENQMR